MIKGLKTMELTKNNLIDCLGDNLVEIKGDFIVSNYSIDSRTLKEGDTFIALKLGADGHDYLDDVIAKKALALLISEEFYTQNKIDFDNLIVVKDTLQALTDISIYNANTFKSNGGKLIGITGSVGKTTMKDMISFILQQTNQISSTFGNFNNNIGLPLSLAHISNKSQFGVFEMGMSSAGEISHLSKILKPQVAIITEIAEAHAEFFNKTDERSSLDLIADAKAEVLDGLDSDATLFLNYDNIYFDYIKNKANNQGIFKIISFSFNNSNADIYVKSVKFKDYKMDVVASILGEDIFYSIKTMAKHNSMLSALAFGVAKCLGIDLCLATENFINFQLPQGRGEILAVSYNDNNIILLDDSYNASFKSMSNSIESLAQVDIPKIIILGDMLELGEKEIEDHKKIKYSLLKVGNIKEVILVGSLMKYLFDDIKKDFKSKHFNNYAEAIDYLKSFIKNNDLIFIKGSHGSSVHKISNHLQR